MATVVAVAIAHFVCVVTLLKRPNTVFFRKLYIKKSKLWQKLNKLWIMSNTPVKFVPDPIIGFWQTWWPMKLLLVALMLAVIVLTILVARNRKKHVVKLNSEPSLHDSTRIKIGLHVYRSDPSVVAKTVFSAFEAAKNAQRVDVYIFQEYDPHDFATDAFSIYSGMKHDNPTCRDCSSRVFVKNAAASRAQGPLAGLGTLGAMMLGDSRKFVCLFARPFYEMSSVDQTAQQAGAALFARDYDETLLSSDLFFSSTYWVYSTQLPRMDAKLEGLKVEPSSNTNLAGIFEPLAKLAAKNLLDVVSDFDGDFVVKKSQASKLFQESRGFVGWATTKHKPNLRVFQAFASQPSNAMLKFWYVSETRLGTYSNSNSNKTPCCVVGVHEDIQVMDSSALKALLAKMVVVAALRDKHYRTKVVVDTIQKQGMLAKPCKTAKQKLKQAEQLRSVRYKLESLLNKLNSGLVVPFQVYNLALSDLVSSSAKSLDLPLVLVAPSGVPLRPSLLNHNFSPLFSSWQVSPDFQAFARISSLGVSKEAYLGVTSSDTSSCLAFKYGSKEVLDRNIRMLS